MNNQIEEERSSILQTLEREDACISISAIAYSTGINRHTVARHMDSLEILGKVRKLEVGRAKKYLLVSKIPEYSLIDISSDLILIVNPHLTVQYLNEAATRHFKTSLHECIGKNIKSLNFPLFMHSEFISILNTFSYENSEQITILDENEFWFEVTILGFSLLSAPNQIAIICTNVTEKKRYEEKFKVAQEKYAFAFHESPDGIVMRDIQTGEILEANPSYCKIIGYQWHEIIGRTCIDLGLFESVDYHNTLIRNINKSESAQHRYELQIHRKSGELIDVSCSSSIIHLPDRDCLLIMIRDISVQKKIDEKIRKSEELYRLLADNTQDMIWTLDPATYLFTYISPSIERLLGYHPETVMKINIREIVTQASYLRMIVKLPYYMKSHLERWNPPCCRLRIHYFTSGGAIIPTDVAISFIKNSAGEITQILGVSRDISSHLEISKKLQKSEHHYRVLAESVKDVVWIMDPKTRVFRYISPSVFQLLGWTPTELCQKRVDEIICPEMVQTFVATCTNRYHEYLDTNNTRYYTDDLKLVTKSGNIIWNEVISHTSRNEESGEVEIIGISRDITEKKSLHLKLVDNEAQFRLIFNNVKDVIWILDIPSFVFSYVSPSIMNLRGYRPDEIVGHSLNKLYSSHFYNDDDIESRKLGELIKAFESGDDTAQHRRITLINRHRDGHLIEVEVSISLIARPDRKVAQIIGISRDISGKENIEPSQYSKTSSISAINEFNLKSIDQ